MLARVALAMAILVHAFPAWICVAACRVRADAATIDACIMVCAAKPTVMGGCCAEPGQSQACSGCCSDVTCEPESLSDQEDPCDAPGCPDCALCICTLGPYQSYPPTQPPTQVPAPDLTPVLTWASATIDMPIVARRPVFSAPARPPWIPTRPMLSVWTI